MMVVLLLLFLGWHAGVVRGFAGLVLFFAGVLGDLIAHQAHARERDALFLTIAGAAGQVREARPSRPEP